MIGEEGRNDKKRRIGDERLHDEVMTCYAASCGLCRRNCPIYDVTGRLVRTLVDRFESAGYHEAVWNGQTDSDAPAASGPYFYRIATPGGEETRKLILLR